LRFIERLKRTIIEASLICLFSSVAAFVFNQAFPNRIPWNWLPEEGQSPEIRGWDYIDLAAALLKFQGKEAVFLDARPRADVLQTGKIHGAYPIDPRTEFEKNYEEMARRGILRPKGIEYVLYCQGGICTDSVELAAALRERGHEKGSLWIMQDGFDIWIDQGYPIDPAEDVSAENRGWDYINPGLARFKMFPDEYTLDPSAVFFVDTRPSDEGVIEGAATLRPEEATAMSPDALQTSFPPEDSEYVFYAGLGGESEARAVADSFVAAGLYRFTQLWVMTATFDDWRRAGLPVSK
jgi:rhodanese-related sulfurtransferase